MCNISFNKELHLDFSTLMILFISPLPVTPEEDWNLQFQLRFVSHSVPFRFPEFFPLRCCALISNFLCSFIITLGLINVPLNAEKREDRTISRRFYCVIFPTRQLSLIQFNQHFFCTSYKQGWGYCKNCNSVK